MTPFHLMLDILHHLDQTFGTHFYSIQNWILPPLPSLPLTQKKRSRYYIHTIFDWIAIKKGTNNLKWELITTALKISYFQKHLWKDIRNYLIYIYMSKSGTICQWRLHSVTCDLYLRWWIFQLLPCQMLLLPHAWHHQLAAFWGDLSPFVASDVLLMTYSYFWCPSEPEKKRALSCYSKSSLERLLANFSQNLMVHPVVWRER